MDLVEQMWAVIEESGTNDHQQRSALGIGRTWVEKRRPHERVVYKEYPNETKRDDLAEKLICLMEANPLGRDGYIQALGKVREKVNAPFFDPTMNGAKSNKAILKPKGKKEAK